MPFKYPARTQETEEGFVLAPPPETADRRTAAEKRHDEKMSEREGEKTRKMAMKSHRERVNDFNAALEQLSEHHDIPRVRGGLHTVTWDIVAAQPATRCTCCCMPGKVAAQPETRCTCCCVSGKARASACRPHTVCYSASPHACQ